MDLIDVPPPYPIVTLLLPDDAGKVKAKVTKIWKPDIFSTRYFVEFPAWEGWTRKVGDSEAHGIAPATLTMWAPYEAVLLGDADIERIEEMLLQVLQRTDFIA